MKPFRYVVALLALSALSGTSQAQSTGGSVVGKITDPAGAMIHEATITLRNVESQDLQEAQPYVGGLYKITNVAPGNYEVSVRATSFQVLTLPRIKVGLDETVRADAVLQPLTAARAGREQPSAGSPDSKSRRQAMFEELPVVEAATLHAQTLADVPANVSVITASDIQRFGYRTLGEALSYVRGFYMTSDRIYNYAGARGLSIPGDYNSRFNVMINGHQMAENIYNSNGFFGQDFGLDMDLVQRIEIVRGPSSAVYGSNGVLTTVNIVTKAPADFDKLRVSSETASYNEGKIFLSGTRNLGKGVNLLFSGSAFHGGERSLLVPGYGFTSNADLQRGYHSFAQLTAGAWKLTSYFNQREKHPPIGWGDAIFDTRGNRVRDGRNFVDLTYGKTLDDGSTVRWQVFYDNYRYMDRFYFDNEGTPEDSRTYQWGDWVGSRASYSVPVNKVGVLSVGIDGRFEIRALHQYITATPRWQETARVSRPDRAGGAFVQQEVGIASRTKAYLGLRYDSSYNFGNFVSPQLALVHKQNELTTFKLVYGRPFRNPSSFEQYFEDGQQYLASNGLRQESAQAFEGSVERKINSKVSAIVNGYHYQLNNLIQAAFLEDVGLQQYQNSGAYKSTGVEFEVAARTGRFLADASVAVQNAREASTRNWLSNSPRAIGKGRVSTPVYKNVLHFATGFQYLSRRATRDGDFTRPVALVDFTMHTNKLAKNFDLVGGIRNAGNYRYDDPIDLVQGRMTQNGRTFFVKLIYRLGE